MSGKIIRKDLICSEKMDEIETGQINNKKRARDSIGKETPVDDNPECKRALFDSESESEDDFLGLTLTSSALLDENKDLKRQLQLLTEEYTKLSDIRSDLKDQNTNLQIRPMNKCKDAQDILAYLEFCDAFQTNCCTDEDLVFLMNRSTVRLAHAGEVNDNFCLSFTMKSLGIIETPTTHLYDDYDEEEENGSEDVYMTPVVHHLRVRFNLGDQVELVERGEESLRYINMGHSYAETKHTIKKYASYFKLPEKALFIILAMAINLLPTKCKNEYKKVYNNPKTLLGYCNKIAGNKVNK